MRMFCILCSNKTISFPLLANALALSLMEQGDQMVQMKGEPKNIFSMNLSMFWDRIGKWRIEGLLSRYVSSSWQHIRFFRIMSAFNHHHVRDFSAPPDTRLLLPGQSNWKNELSISWIIAAGSLIGLQSHLPNTWLSEQLFFAVDTLPDSQVK